MEDLPKGKVRYSSPPQIDWTKSLKGFHAAHYQLHMFIRFFTLWQKGMYPKEVNRNESFP
jgi:hypothetical protein